MDENSKKEEFSYAYICILASICGYITHPPRRAEDNYLKVDLHIIDSQSLDDGGAPRIYVQAKCTTPKYFYESEKHFKFDLKAKDYNQLIKKSLDPHILIVSIIPENIEESIIICKDKQESLIRGCAYWLSLEGMEKTEKTKIRVQIPKENLLTPATLKEIMKISLERRRRIFGILETENKVE
jgi:hypothetical protein